MMSDFLTLTKLRRSVRTFQLQLPSEEALAYIMECVRMALSAVNFQPWKFRYVTAPEELERVVACYDRPWIKEAPACFIAYRDTSREWVRKSDGKPHGDIDVAIAVEHLCLAAAEQGLGTCWVCNFDVQKCLELFPVPEHLVPVVVIPIGYPKDEVQDKKRKAVEELFL